jgi:hypothetical protein
MGTVDCSVPKGVRFVDRMLRESRGRMGRQWLREHDLLRLVVRNPMVLLDDYGKLMFKGWVKLW